VSREKHPRLVVLELTAGQLRIPFTAQNRSPNSAQVFPRRSAPNNVFLFGTDLGGLLSFSIFEERLELSGGVFNGTGRAAGESNERGALYAGRFDINPLGGFDFKDTDLERGKFRFGVGGGILYFPSRVFDSAGQATESRARDLRMSGSVRMAVKGFSLQAEVFRRQRTDSLSSLPEIATGAYAQSSVYVPVYRMLGLAPAGRFGWTALDQSFDPRTTYHAEGGLAIYLGNEKTQVRDMFKLIAQYTGEWRVTEQENAHGVSIQTQLKF
jgi:hypothetical protein